MIKDQVIDSESKLDATESVFVKTNKVFATQGFIFSEEVGTQLITRDDEEFKEFKVVGKSTYNSFNSEVVITTDIEPDDKEMESTTREIHDTFMDVAYKSYKPLRPVQKKRKAVKMPTATSTRKSMKIGDLSEDIVHIIDGNIELLTKFFDRRLVTLINKLNKEYNAHRDIKTLEQLIETLHCFDQQYSYFYGEDFSNDESQVYHKLHKGGTHILTSFKPNTESYEKELAYFTNISADVVYNVVLNSDDLLDLTSEMMKSCNQDDNRYIYEGINITFSNGKLVMTATDGRQLLIKSIGVEYVNCEYKEDVSAVIPYTFFKEMEKYIGDDQKVLLTLSKSVNKKSAGGEVKTMYWLHSYVSDSLLAVEQLEGKYPDANKVVPEKVVEPIVMDKESLKVLLNQLLNTELTEKPSDAIQIDLRDLNKDGSLEFRGIVENVSTFRYKNRSTIKTYNDKFQLFEDVYLYQLNGTYLFNIVSAMKGDPEFYFNGGDRPLLLLDTKDSEFLGLIMPMRI